MTTYISLDTETWGKRAGCDLRSIGATVFHPYQIDAVIPPRNSPAMFYQAVENPELNPGDPIHDEGDSYWDGVSEYRKYPLFRDPSTVQWWSEQSAEAQAAFSNPIDLKDGLQLFAQWLAQVAPDPKQTVIYCHGQHFDLPIVEAACHAVGMEAPWFYRAPRDTRTIFDAAGIDDHSAYLNSFAQGDEVYHHALDDAIVQARAVAAALRKVTPIGRHTEAWIALKKRFAGAEFEQEYPTV
jgi:hypothetical protein